MISRNQDFMRECRRQRALALDRGESPTIDQIVTRAASSPAPAYYVGYDRTLRLVSPIFHGRRPPRHDTTVDRRTAEIAAKCREEVESSHGRLTLPQALARVIGGSPASNYFMSPSYARRLYYRIRRKPRSRN